MNFSRIENRNKDLEKLYFTCTKEDAITYHGEYAYEYYTEDYTQWLEHKVVELTKLIKEIGIYKSG